MTSHKYADTEHMNDIFTDDIFVMLMLKAADYTIYTARVQATLDGDRAGWRWGTAMGRYY